MTPANALAVLRRLISAPLSLDVSFIRWTPMVSLNPAQRTAVEHDTGPLLVLAGAGSGKTRVITHRIARLVQTRGIRPSAILAVSFTNKAAAEMAERMIPLIGRTQTEALWLSTFHRFGVRFLSEEWSSLGYSSRFVIFDQADSIGAIREIVRREGLADRKLDLWAVQSRISLWKNQGLRSDQVPERDYEYDLVARETYPHYEAALQNMCAVDFDDLVFLPARLLSEREDLREKWRKRFRYMLIDEFQDTNRIQMKLVKLLANEQHNVCVVGDDDQSIYGWRGAEVGNILDFESHFRGTTVVKLEENYRSRAPILDLANAAIARAKRPRHEKVLRPIRGEGSKVRMCTASDPDAEAKFVAKEIRQLQKEGVKWSEVAVLYRSNLQARPIEEELRVEGIGYRLYGGTQFFDRKEVKDAVAYLRLVIGPHDELSLRRVINFPPRGIGDTTIKRLTRFSLATGQAFTQTFARMDNVSDLPEGAKRGGRALRAALAKARTQFQTGSNLTQAAKQLFQDVGLERLLKEDKNPKAAKRWANVEYVLRSLSRYEQSAADAKPSLAQFLNRITLRIEDETEDTGERVTLSSLHASKGLEFNVVFLIGLNEGQLPHSRTTDPKLTEAAPSDVEEERRLFYVGVTRAREQLYLCRPRRRAVRGKALPLIPSRFLEGLPEERIEHFERISESVVQPDEAVQFGRALLDQLKKRN